MTDNKKKLGQFFTDPQIADFMAKLVIDSNTTNVLDPAAGAGAFGEAVHKINDNIKLYSYEIDDKVIKELKEKCSFEYELKHEDYLYAGIDLKYDSIICNPPYYKFQEIKDRKELIEAFKKRYRIALSGYTNYCIYFLIKSLNELNNKGKCCYIIPYEFLNCRYGENVKKYFLEKKYLKTIYKFDNTLKLFDGATTTSCILYFEKEEHQQINFISITDVEELKTGKFKNIIIYNYKELDPKEKWINYYKSGNEIHHYKNLVRLSKIGKVKRGIATGNNKYFSLNKAKIKDLNLSKEVCIPCVTKSPDVKTLKFTKDDFDKLYNENKNVYIFDGTKAATQEDRNYIKYGEEMKYHESYLTSHRCPWYAVEEKDISPILISVFSRNKLKIIRNEAKVKNLTAFHSLFIIDKSLENLYFCYLITPIAQEILFLNKREYGEGLDKFEPNDLNNCYVFDVNIMSDHDKNEVLNIYDHLDDTKIEQLNAIFTKYIK